MSITPTSSILTKLYRLGIASDDYFSENSPFDDISFVRPFYHAGYNNSTRKLQSVGIYQTIDLLCEGEIDGLANKDGSLIQLTNNVNKNENGLKGIYLNDVQIKDSGSNTLNFNRVFADFRTGKNRQPKLSSFVKEYLSFTKSYQTLNVNSRLVGLGGTAGLDEIFLNMFADEPPVGQDTNGFFSRDIAGRVIKYNTNTLSYQYLENETQELDTVVKVGANIFRELQANLKTLPLAYTHSVTNRNVNTVAVTFSIASLKTGTSTPFKSTINLVVKVGYAGDDTPFDTSSNATRQGSCKYFLLFIHGVATSNYERTYFFRLPPNFVNYDRQIKIHRIDVEPGVTDISNSKYITVKSVTEIVDTPFSYPKSSICGCMFDARSFSQPPKRTFNVRMKKVLVPSNYDPESRNYSGNWDGLFKTQKEWTDNPAWIFYDLATNTTYGAGKFGFADYFLDKWNLYQISKYCDELVPTGRSSVLQNFTFTIDGPWVTVTPTDDYDINAVKSELPNGSIVVFVDTYDSNGVNLEKSYRRLIVHATEYEGNWKFKTCKIPVAKNLFVDYPALKDEYYNTNNEVFTENEWLISLLIQSVEGQESDYPFVNDFTQNGFPLDEEVIGGTLVAELSTNGLFSLNPIVEPRFKCNLYLDRSQNALDALNDIAAVFRGMMYWTAGYMFLSNDKKRDPVLLFTNANVIDGDFTYSGSANTSRTTVIIVRYNDETDSYKPKVEYLEDSAGIRDHGYQEKEVIALGVTSKTQAHRLAKWMLYTNQTETDTIQFSTGQEASFLQPGDTIKIQDKLKSAKRYGGRLVDVDAAAKKLVIDEGIADEIVGQKISVVIGSSNYDVEDLNNLSKSQENGVSDSDINKRRQPQVKEFTISSVEDTNKIFVISADFEDIVNVKSGAIWSIANTNTDSLIQEVLYRVLSIIEKSPNEYQVTAMMYNETKFNAVDRFSNVKGANSLQSKSTSSIYGFALPSALQAVNSDIVVQKFYIDLKTSSATRYDGRFDIGTWNNRNVTDTTPYVKLFIDWSQVANESGVTSSNTGGYILEVTRGSSESIRVTLDGFDNTSADILFGTRLNSTGHRSFGVTVYRYDTNRRLETLGLPV